MSGESLTMGLLCGGLFVRHVHEIALFQLERTLRFTDKMIYAHRNDLLRTDVRDTVMTSHAPHFNPSDRGCNVIITK